MSSLSDQPPPTTPRPGAPPAQAAVPPARQTVWPMVIGIIAIVLGALGVLGGCAGLVFTPMLTMMEDVFPPGQPSPLEEVADMVPALMVVAFAGLLVAALLVLAGSGLASRKPWAMTAALAWAVVKMIFVVVNVYVSFEVNRAQFEAMQGDPNMPAFMSALFPAMGAFGSCIGIAWGWIFPVFMLIWFSRPKIRSEVRDWRAGRDE